MNRVVPALIGVAFSVAPAHAQVLDGALSGLAFGDAVEIAVATLGPDCRTIQTYELGAPQLPVAERHEAHLTCRGYESVDGVAFDLLVLRFADGALALIEARGPDAAALAPAEAQTMEYGGFEAHMTEREVVLIDDETAWVVRPRDMHPHPFYVPSTGLTGGDAGEPIVMSVSRPEALAFGASIDDVRSVLLPNCVWTHEFEIDPPELPTNPETQTQIDCFGFPYAGFPRKVEAVFADGVLELAWILTGKPEETRIRGALIAEFGEPIHTDDETEVFGDGSVVLRKDKPEVLLLSPKMAAAFQTRTE